MVNTRIADFKITHFSFFVIFVLSLSVLFAAVYKDLNYVQMAFKKHICGTSLK